METPRQFPLNHSSEASRALTHTGLAARHSGEREVGPHCTEGLVLDKRDGQKRSQVGRPGRKEEQRKELCRGIHKC